MNYKSFHIATWNANGLRTQLADINKLIEEADLDWVFICETQWEEKNRDPRNAISSQIGHKSIESRTNYGSMILTNRNKPLEIFEILEVGQYGNYQIFRWRGAIFMGVYISPSATVEEEDAWIERFSKCLSYKKHPDEVVVLLGDFNMRSGNQMGDTKFCRRARKIGLWIASQDFELAIQKPNEEGKIYTHRSNNRYSTIDYIFFLGDVIVDESEIYYHRLRSDHFLVSMKARYNPIGTPPVPKSLIRWKLYRLEDPDIRKGLNDRFESRHKNRLCNFIDQLSERPENLDQNSVDRIDEEIRSAIAENANAILGLSKVTKGEMRLYSQKLDEMNVHCKELSKVLDIKHTEHINIEEYQHLSRELSKAKKEAQEEARRCMLLEWHKWVDDLDSKPGHLIMKHLCAAKNSRIRARGNLLKTDNSSLEDYKRFFEGQFNNTCTGAAPFDKTVYLKPPPSQGDYFNEERVRAHISTLSTGKAPGRSGIRNELIKHCSEAISPVICKFFNLCIKVGYVPSNWRIARIVPIPKKERATNIADHRPISLTEILRKLFERLLLPYINGYIENKLDIAQGGFRSSRGTIETIASLNETIIQFESKFHNRNPVIAFLDIQKAYDSVDWNVLIRQLKEDYSMPEDMVWMIIELFTGVKSMIAINGVESSELVHRAGVLQGSVISPILYSSYINSLARSIRQSLGTLRPNETEDPQSIFMYADDVAIVARNDIEMEAVLRSCEEHSREIHYKFNVRKCEVMNARSEHTIYGEPVPHCNEFKYLGIMVDKKGITWERHLNRMSDKTERMLNFFRSVGFNMYGFRERTRLQLYKTFLRPLFEYGLCMMPPLSKYSKKLDSLQNKCLNALFSTYTNTSKAALETLTHLPNMSHRWKELSFRWKTRLLTRDQGQMATIARNRTRRHLKRRSGFAMMDMHPFDEKWTRWIDEDPQNKRKIISFITEQRKEYLERRREETLHLKRFPIDPECKPRQMYKLSTLDRKTARLDTLWMLGKITGKPRECLRCNEENASYKHFIRCAGVGSIDEKIQEGMWYSLCNDIKKIIRIAEGLGRLLQIDNG